MCPVQSPQWTVTCRRLTSLRYKRHSLHGVMPCLTKESRLKLPFPQDISHVLESLFKETYTKNIIGQDTLTNLIKTKSGKNSYHDRYVEELQQVRLLHYRGTKITKPKPKWKGGPSATERTEGQDTLRKMKERQNFLRNPRFLPPNTQISNMVTRSGCSDDRLQVFQAEPPVLFFVQYTVGQIYELKNMTSASRHVRVIPPTTPYFSIGLGRFPGEGGTVAPGMSCKYTIRFAPDSLTDFQDFIVVESQSDDLLVVPIEARRPPPVLTLPRVLDCGCCLVGGVKFVEFFCQNVGLSPGTFCLIPKYQWPSVSKTVFTEQPPFAVSPSLFSLQPGETTVVEVVFFPTTTEKTCQVFTIVCDNCQVKDICVQGEGQLIALELISISGDRDTPSAGELHDLTAEHFVCFSPCNPNSPQQKKIVVRNNVHLELPFHWQIVKPHLQPLPSGEDTQSSHVEFLQETDDIFHVCPESGLLGPCQDHVFLVTFWPKEVCCTLLK
uniref:Uncharacterized protein n=1 Tax=Periophthalmus magnuspinnatus TaxID=409849 RepID=A0A3B3ZMU7_9GOBI